MNPGQFTASSESSSIFPFPSSAGQQQLGWSWSEQRLAAPQKLLQQSCLLLFPRAALEFSFTILSLPMYRDTEALQMTTPAENNLFTSDASNCPGLVFGSAFCWK